MRRPIGFSCRGRAAYLRRTGAHADDDETVRGAWVRANRENRSVGA